MSRSLRPAGPQSTRERVDAADAHYLCGSTGAKAKNHDLALRCAAIVLVEQQVSQSEVDGHPGHLDQGVEHVRAVEDDGRRARVDRGACVAGLERAR
jgi:hypothetical protein